MEQGNTTQKIIHVIATVEIVEGKREEYLTAFKELVPLVLAEKGCIEYGPFFDIQTAIPI
jgi:quinol monooxygenase YgiN